MRSNRYDVYPGGAYSVGDRWYAAVEHHDSPNTYDVADGWVNGAFGYVWCGEYVSPWACHWHSVTDHKWQTKFNVYEFRPLEWQLATGILFNPADPSHGWVYRGYEWRSGQSWS